MPYFRQTGIADVYSLAMEPASLLVASYIVMVLVGRRIGLATLLFLHAVRARRHGKWYLYPVSWAFVLAGLCLGKWPSPHLYALLSRLVKHRGFARRNSIRPEVAGLVVATIIAGFAAIVYYKNGAAELDAKTHASYLQVVREAEAQSRELEFRRWTRAQFRDQIRHEADTLKFHPSHLFQPTAELSVFLNTTAPRAIVPGTSDSFASK